MKFTGFAYTYKYKRKLLDPSTNFEHTEHSIDGKNIKKYIRKGTWIVSANYSYLQNIKLFSYIRKSDVFARIIIDTETETFKFDYLKDRKYTNQIVINNGQFISSYGKLENFNGGNFLEYVEMIFKQTLHLTLSELDPSKGSFLELKSCSKKITNSDYFSEVRLVLNALPSILLSPFMVYYSIKLIIIIINEKVILGYENWIFLISAFALSAFSLAAVVTYGYLKARNLFLIKTKLTNDSALTS